MTTAKDKIQQRADLTSKGYSWSYLKDWQPRVDMWWHKNWLNNEGDVVMPAGTKVPNQPGNPDTQVRLSNRGMRPWPPSDDCSCIWCRRQAAGLFTPGVEESVAEPIGIVDPSMLVKEGDESPPVLVETVSLKTAEHRHKYMTNRLGSKCTVDGCSAKRVKTGTKKRL